MAVAANQIHVRTVQFWNAFQAHPELHAMMSAELKAAIEEQVELVLPWLEIANVATEEDDQAAGKVEAVFQRAHDLLRRLHEGARYRYHTQTAGLTALAPLNVGRSPEEDEVRLATFLQKVPDLAPPFLWPADEGVTLASSQKILRELREAIKVAPSLDAGNQRVAQALASLRAARPASQALWDDDGGRLDAWVLAHVSTSQQFAFGRDRRKRPRGAAGEPVATTTQAPAAK